MSDLDIFGSDSRLLDHLMQLVLNGITHAMKAEPHGKLIEGPYRKVLFLAVKSLDLRLQSAQRG